MATMRKRSGCTPRQRYQTPPVKDLQMRGHRRERQQAGLHQKRPRCRQAVRVFCTRYHARTHPKRPIATEPVNRGFCVLRSWRTGECPQQYSWKRRASQGGAGGLPRSGGCYQNARYFKESSALSASHR